MCRTLMLVAGLSLPPPSFLGVLGASPDAAALALGFFLAAAIGVGWRVWRSMDWMGDLASCGWDLEL